MVQFYVVLQDSRCFWSRKPHAGLEFLAHGSRLEALNQFFLTTVNRELGTLNHADVFLDVAPVIWYTMNSK